MLNKTLKFSIIDIAAIIFIVATISFVFVRMSSVLEYNWEWDAIPSYFFFLDVATGKLKALLNNGLSAEPTWKLSGIFHPLFL